MRETVGGALSCCQGHTAYRMKKPAAFSDTYLAFVAQVVLDE
jgi:hypothetical protein